MVGVCAWMEVGASMGKMKERARGLDPGRLTSLPKTTVSICEWLPLKRFFLRALDVSAICASGTPTCAANETDEFPAASAGTGTLRWGRLGGAGDRRGERPAHI